MPTVIVKEASAGSAVGTNIMSGNRFQTATTWRKVVRVGVTGSNAAAAGSMDLLYGSTVIANGLSPTTSGAVIPLEAKDILPIRSDYWCEPGEPINVIITAVSTTTPFTLLLEIDEK